MSSHTGIYPYNCTICNHGCRQRNRLITHLKTAHPSEWASLGEAGLAPPRWSGFQQEFKNVEVEWKVLSMRNEGVEICKICV